MRPLKFGVRFNGRHLSHGVARLRLGLEGKDRRQPWCRPTSGTSSTSLLTLRLRSIPADSETSAGLYLSLVPCVAVSWGVDMESSIGMTTFATTLPMPQIISQPSHSSRSTVDCLSACC